MDKTIVGVLAAIGSIAPMAAAHAGVTPDEVDRAMSASSFAELLQSVPNAPAILKAAKQQRAESPRTKYKSRSIITTITTITTTTTTITITTTTTTTTPTTEFAQLRHRVSLTATYPNQGHRGRHSSRWLFCV